MIFLIIQWRSMRSNKESFSCAKISVSFYFLLQYLKMVHKEVIPNFGFETNEDVMKNFPILFLPFCAPLHKKNFS